MEKVESQTYQDVLDEQNYDYGDQDDGVDWKEQDWPENGGHRDVATFFVLIVCKQKHTHDCNLSSKTDSGKLLAERIFSLSTQRYIAPVCLTYLVTSVDHWAKCYTMGHEKDNKGQGEQNSCTWSLIERCIEKNASTPYCLRLRAKSLQAKD